MLKKAEKACKQISKNDGLAKPTTLAKAKTSQEAIDWIITITANIADGIE